jgi:hypothetical protein
VGPLLLATAGVVVLGVAAAILRSFGSGYRVGRLLAVAPRVTVADAVAIADSGHPEYVRIDGRIDSDQEWEDEDHRPLVLLRTRLDWRPASGGAWTQASEDRRVVPFLVREGLDEIAVDGEALDEGLVAVPRLSVGTASEVADLTSAGVSPDATARYRVERLSTVDHATVLGVPSRRPDGTRIIGPGLGRPLILSTLEDDEAMRVLAGGAAARSRLAVACLVGGALLIVVAAGWWLLDAVVGGGVATAVAASPQPTLRPGSDTRTTGSSPSFVGEPFLALLGVLGVALLSVVASLAWIRFTGGRRTTSR